MIKTKLFFVRGYYKNNSWTSDYKFCIYLFGFLIKAINLDSMSNKDAMNITGKKEVIDLSILGID